MTALFLGIYDFLRRRFVLRLLVLVIVTGIPFYFALKIQLQEDISSFMPHDQQSERINFVYKNMRIADKMIFRFSLADTTSDDIQKLKDAADFFVSRMDSLPNRNDYIKTLFYQVDQEQMLTIAGFITENIPYFLTETDYDRIDSLLNEQKIAEILEANKKILITPAGLVLKKNIIADPLHISTGALNRLRNFQVSDQYMLDDGYIVTKDGKNLMVFITTANSSSETARNQQLIKYIDEWIDSCNYRFNKHVTINYFGAAAVAVANANQIKADSYLSITIAVVLILVLLYWFFRSLKPMLLIAVPVAFGAILALAAMYFIKGSVSAIAIGAASAIFGIAINYSLHFLIHSRHSNNPAKVISDLASPMVTGSITTVGAFLSLLFISSESMRDFGLFAAISLAGTLLFTLVFMPHFIGKSGKNHEEKASDLLSRISEYRFEKNKWIVWTTLLLTILFFYFSFRVAFEADMNKINFMTPEQKKAFAELSSFTSLGKKSAYLVSEGKNLDEALRQYESSKNKVDSLIRNKTILYANGIGSFLPSDSLQKARIERWNHFWELRRDKVLNLLSIEGQKAGFNATSFNTFTELLHRDFKVENPSYFDILTDAFSHDYLIERTDRAMVISILYYLPEKNDDFRKDLTNNQSFVFDASTITKTLINTLSNDFNVVLYISSLLVLVFLTISFGRIELGLISFLPMMMSWIWILGMMPLLDIRFNIVNIILATFIFGLGDDYTVFMIDGLMNEYAYGKKLLNSYKTAVILSAITMLIGIGTLVFAKHPAMKSLGNVTIIGMLAVVVISFIVPPLLYSWLTTKKGRKRLTPITVTNFSATIFSFVYFLLGSLMLNIRGFFLLTILKPTDKRKYRFHKILYRNSRIVVKGIPLVKTEIQNTTNETFEKPAVIICNHQSHIDLMFTLMLSPRVVILTNEWVWNSPFYGRIVKYADFYPVANGIENSVDQLESLVKRGYSILIFPEGTRSEDCSILRFHRGAFFLAEKLNLDILPVVFHGIGHALPKSELLLRHGKVTGRILPRIHPDDKTYGEGYSQRAKHIRQYFTKEYQQISQEQETPAYFRQLIIHNYIYKGFSVERQARKLLKKYNVFKELIEALPEKGKVLVPNCGYGVLALTIALVKKNLEIIGIDSDEDKINLAGHCISKPLNLTYLVTEEYTGPLDVIVLLTDNKRQNDKWSKRPCEKKVNGSYFTLLIIGQHE